MKLYISDLHFGHENVIRFDGRPFTNADEMDLTLIELWNARVQEDDTVYIVGDLCYRSALPAEWYLNQLKGHKYLILGNHDGQILKNPAAQSLLEGIETTMQIEDGGERITLCHYPIAEWNAYHRGAWHIYGHIHNRRDETYHFMKTKKHALNAGCMINGYMPVSLKELIRNNERFQAEEGDDGSEDRAMSKLD